MVCHRRAGKTVACVNDLIRRALVENKPNARYAYIAPYYSQAKSVAWDYLLRFSEPVRVNKNAGELWVELVNGARIRLFGGDTPDSLRGLYFDGVVLDEFAQMRPSIWGEILRPALADRQGWAVFIGTPKGHNNFYKVWQESDKDPRWFRFMLRASESNLLLPAELEDAAAGMSADQYDQEFECSFEAAILGAYYGQEMMRADKEGRISDVPYDYLAPVHTAWDLGYSDDTSIWFYQVIAGEVRVINHYSSNGKDVKHYGNYIKQKTYNYGFHHLPHDARAKTLASGGKSTIEQLAEILGMESLRVVPNLSVQDGIQAVRKMFPRVWFDAEKCHEGIESLRQYQREWDEKLQCFKEKPRHDWTSHDADSFRMLGVAWSEEHASKEPEKQLYPVVGTKQGFQLAPLEVLWKDNATRSKGRL